MTTETAGRTLPRVRVGRMLVIRTTAALTLWVMWANPGDLTGTYQRLIIGLGAVLLWATAAGCPAGMSLLAHFEAQLARYAWPIVVSLLTLLAVSGLVWSLWLDPALHSITTTVHQAVTPTTPSWLHLPWGTK